MLAAIIAAVIAGIVVIAIAAVIILARSRFKSQRTGYSGQSVKTVRTVGVSSSLDTNTVVGSGPSENGTPRSTPADSLTSRFIAMGVFAVGVFGALAVKLFGMQVLNSDSYETAAEDNQYTTVSTPAPRGYICDRTGIPLVKNRSSLTVLSDADVADDRDVVGRLSAVLGIPRNIIRTRIQDTSSGAQSQRTIVSDASLREVAFIREHSDAFPGVTVESRTVRDYPYGALAAHAVGYTGSVSDDELEAISEGRTIELGDDVGKSGVEAAYDDVLAGDHGQRVCVTDADGNVRSVESETQPVKGSDVYTTICAPAQYVAEKALADLIAPEDGTIGTGIGVAGTVVALDVRDGSVVVLANFPTYAPASFVGGITQSIWDTYNTEESQYPLLNRALAGTYPAASTFKAFTGMAGLEYGFADEERTWDCSGSWDGFGSGDWQDCWLETGHGTETFRQGIVNSCDVVFYEIAKDFWDAAEDGTLSYDAMQDVIKQFGFNAETGIDIQGEAAGRIPTKEWKKEYFKDVPEEASWRGGDMTNMVIGQGYVLVTPLQVACAYAGIATGKVYKPHLLKEVRNEEGDVVVSHQSEVLITPNVKEENLKIVRDALHGVVQDNSAYNTMFSNYGIDAACKTGTAEVAGKNDFAWFACYAPYDEPRYVVAGLIEEGLAGGTNAGPVCAATMNALFQADEGNLTEADIESIPGSTGKYQEPEETTTSEGRTD